MFSWYNSESQLGLIIVILTTIAGIVWLTLSLVDVVKVLRLPLRSADKLERMRRPLLEFLVAMLFLVPSVLEIHRMTLEKKSKEADSKRLAQAEGKLVESDNARKQAVEAAGIAMMTANAARQDVTKAEAELKEGKEVLSQVEPLRIPAEQQQATIEALKPFAGTRIDIFWVHSDSRGMYVAHQLKSILEQAG